MLIALGSVGLRVADHLIPRCYPETVHVATSTSSYRFRRLDVAATHCFHQRRFLACIAMASAAVEIILNRDRRLRALPNFKSSDGWAYLNNRTLRIARDSGLPSNALLSHDDDLDSQTPPLASCNARNTSTRRRPCELVSDTLDLD